MNITACWLETFFKAFPRRISAKKSTGFGAILCVFDELFCVDTGHGGGLKCAGGARLELSCFTGFPNGFARATAFIEGCLAFLSFGVFSMVRDFILVDCFLSSAA